MKPFTVVFTGGGSGGHVTPNFALIDYLKKICPDINIHYIGSNGIEKTLVTPEKAIFHEITARGFSRDKSEFLKNFAVPFSLIKSVRQSVNILKNIRPDVVFSKGGYVALPVVIAAKKLGIRAIIHESDMSVGLANKISKIYADICLSSFPLLDKKFICVGSPLNQKIYTANKTKSKNYFNLGNSKKILLITGGSLGAEFLNEFVKTNFENLTKKFNLILICGKGKKLNIKNDKNFYQTEYTVNMPVFYAAADLCLTRGGSNTLCELSVLGIPFVCVPLLRSGRGEQRQNAEFFSTKGHGVILDEKNLDIKNFLSLSSSLKTKSGTSFDGTKLICEYILGK